MWWFECAGLSERATIATAVWQTVLVKILQGQVVVYSSRVPPRPQRLAGPDVLHKKKGMYEIIY